MPISPYLKALREKVGHERLLAPAAAMVPIKDDRALLARNAETGEWQTLGGMIEPLEHPADGAVREAYEEGGILTEPTRIIGVFSGPETEITYPNGDIVSYTVIAFAGRLLDPDAALRPDGEEIASLRWVEVREIEQLAIRPFNQRIALAALAPDRGALFDPARWRPDAPAASDR